MGDVEQRLKSLRRDLVWARNRLADAVLAACPGLHEPRQHRDRKPPWCPACGRDQEGIVRADRTPAAQPEQTEPTAGGDRGDQ